MATLKKQTPGIPSEKSADQKGPDVVGTLRAWVGQDYRIARTEANPDPIEPLSNPKRADPDQLRPIQPFQDISDRDSADPSASAHPNADDFHPAPPIHGLFEPDPHENLQTEISRASAAARYPVIDPERLGAASRFGAPGPQHEDPQAFRPSVTSRVWRTVTHGFVAVALACVVFAFLSNGGLEQRGDLIRSAPANNQDPQPSAASQLSPVLQQQLVLQQQQLETMAKDFAAVGRTAERLAARQEEMTQNIATLQASEQSLRQQLTALTQATIQNPAAQARRHRQRPLKRNVN
jgi:hypothetical protein